MPGETIPHGGEHLRERPIAQRHDARVVGLSFAASLAAHALVIVGLPAPSERVAPAPEILSVTIEKPAPAPPRPAAPPDRVNARVERPSTKPLQSAAPARVPQERETPREVQTPLPATTSREVLSIPREATSAETQFTVPAPERPEPPRDMAKGTRATPEAAAPAPAKPSAPQITDARVLDAPVRYPRTSERGRVTLKVLVSREGRAASATMEKSSGYPNLDRDALQAIKRWRFAPARQGSETVEQVLTVNVDY